MKILFSNPSWWPTVNGELRRGVRSGSRWPFSAHLHHQPGRFEFGGYLPAPLFMQQAASYTQILLPEAKVELRDSIARGETYAEFYDYINISNPDWVVIETATPSLEHDLHVIKNIQNISGDSRIILAGPIDCSHHQSILDNHGNVHAIVRGEFDKQVAKAIKSPRGVHEHDLMTHAELRAAPLPMYDEACNCHYYDACPKGAKPPQLHVWTSRGCVFKCCFCVWPAVMSGNDPDGTHARPVRTYTADYMERWIRERLSKVNYQTLWVDDDSFNLSDRHTLEMCGVFKKIGLPWAAMCRADTIKRETWQAMKDSGCYGVKIGFESGSQWVIDHIVNKKLDIAEAASICEWLQKSVGINVHTTWTVGLPGETAEHQAQTINLINAMYEAKAHSTHQLSGTATISGTPLASIAAGAKLAKYDGAVADARFRNTGDGQRKIEEMLR